MEVTTPCMRSCSLSHSSDLPPTVSTRRSCTGCCYGGNRPGPAITAGLAHFAVDTLGGRTAYFHRAVAGSVGTGGAQWHRHPLPVTGVGQRAGANLER